ncbi:VOC family protein [Amycolatopsis sp. K13G38]|uniref:VOC family protein n=1 Tax=Amycolatopsis acididurans TaxID=2724524 RepID=A0ABX1J3D8_9PSEU|nr:VOC family protein [Amycolatopsis acididurans]NKQ54268.1 VOC family protein [Amycolatopsis acididurans]
MGAQLVKPTIDIGIVTTNPEAMADFYGTVIGFPPLPDVPMDGFRVKRFQVGECVLKIVTFDDEPGGRAVTGTLGDSTGLRYWTVSVANLGQILAAVEGAGQKVVDGPTEVRPGVTIALVTDPDGNLLEFVNRPAT